MVSLVVMQVGRVTFQVEIDEFQNYEKALGALGEACKVLSHAKLPDNSQEMKMNDIKNRMAHVKKFAEAKALVPDRLITVAIIIVIVILIAIITFSDFFLGWVDLPSGLSLWPACWVWIS